MKKYILFVLICLKITTCLSQEKDTLFFYYDKDYLEKYEGWPGHYYPEDTNGDEGAFFFMKDSIYYHLKPKKIFSLKSYLHLSKFYDEKTRKITYFRLPELFENYVVFLVINNKKEIQYVKVYPGVQII